MKKIMLGAGMAALLAGGAFAADQAQRPDPKSPITRAEVKAKVDARFNAADTNHDGILTRAEYDAARTAMKAKFEARMKERADARFAEMDADKNGQISKAEYDNARAARKAKWEEAKTDGKWQQHRGMRHGMHHGMRGMRGGPDGADLFDRMDANKDGKVTLAEAEAGPLAHFDKADANKDGTLTPEERQAAHKAMRDAWKAKHDPS